VDRVTYQRAPHLDRFPEVLLDLRTARVASWIESISCRSTVNSSPPIRATVQSVPPPRAAPESARRSRPGSRTNRSYAVAERRATSCSTLSPIRCPRLSLMFLNRSISTKMIARPRPSSACAPGRRSAPARSKNSVRFGDRSAVVQRQVHHCSVHLLAVVRRRSATREARRCPGGRIADRETARQHPSVASRRVAQSVSATRCDVPLRDGSGYAPRVRAGLGSTARATRIGACRRPRSAWPSAFPARRTRGAYPEHLEGGTSPLVRNTDCATPTDPTDGLLSRGLAVRDPATGHRRASRGPERRRRPARRWKSS